MRTVGIVLAMLSAALFGASTPFAKLLLESIDPWLLAALFYLGAGLGLACVRFVRRSFGARPARRRCAARISPGLLSPCFRVELPVRSC